MVVFMYIVQIATELAPIAKVGGLGDVLHGLSKELVKLGHKVEIILPKYDSIDFSQCQNLKILQRDLITQEGKDPIHNTIWTLQTDGLTLYLIEPHHPTYYFSRGKIYGCPDDVERFCYFSKAALEFLYQTKRAPDVIHLHDWPTAIVAVLYKEMYKPLRFLAKGTLLTIHNLEHQGKCTLQQLSKLGLKSEKYLSQDKMQDPTFLHMLNLLKGGIYYADALSCVSPNYEKEIKTKEGGCGLHMMIQRHAKKMTGILNGIDETHWNPEKDPHLLKRYPGHHIETKEKLQKILEAKAENRQHLRKHFGLQESKAPLVVSITRLVEQKGPKLIKEGIKRVVEKDGQFLLLGSVPTKEIAKEFQDLAKALEPTKNFALFLDHDEALAHQLFAAADMLLIPSLFEPCGLTQLIALRYGTIPIARKTGGLADTVFDADDESVPLSLRNGFTFQFPDTQGVHWAVDRALDCFMKHPKRWQEMMQHGMNQDFSWAHAAPLYVKKYTEIVEQTPSFQERVRAFLM